MPSPEDTQGRHARYVDGLTAGFKDALERMVNRVRNRVIALIAPELDLDTHRRVLPTAGNLKALRRLDKLFMSEMDRAGFQSLLTALTSQFTPGSFPFYNEVLDSMTSRLKTPLPKVKFSTSFKGFMAQQETTARQTIRGVVEKAAATAMQRASMSVGAVPFEDLAQILSEAYGVSIGQAETLARTSLVTFWRSIVSESFRQIEDGLPPGAVAYYKYVNPVDKLTRPFCRKHANKVYTRAQIEKMDNGTKIPVWIGGGGWNCRGHWVLDHIKYPSRASRRS